MVSVSLSTLLLQPLLPLLLLLLVVVMLLYILSKLPLVHVQFPLKRFL